MTNIIPLSKLAKGIDKNIFSKDSSVVINKNGTPLGFMFGRDSFIVFLQYIDDQFEIKIKDYKKAFKNPAGELIDLIEEKLKLNPEFVKKLKLTVKDTKQWIPIKDIMKYFHVQS